MNILMLLDNSFPHDERVEKEALSLIQNGHSVSLLCFNYAQDKNKDNYKGIKIYREAFSKNLRDKLHPFSATISYYQNKWIMLVEKRLTKEQYDIIHAHDLILCSIAHRIKKKHNIKYIADTHENFPSLLSMMYYMKNPIIRKLVNIKLWYKKEKKWLSNADAIITTSEGMKTRLINIGLNNNRYCVLENTIKTEDIQLLDTPQPDDNFITLIYTGGLTVHRGVQYALLAYNKVKQQIPNVRFWVVGGGIYTNTLKKIIKKVKIQDVTFWGWKSQSEMFKYIYQADLCIIPHVKSEHTNNTTPNKIFHYFYAKKPVLVSNCDFLLTIVKENRTGLVFEDKNVDDIKDRILEIIKDKERWEEYGNNGYESVIRKYNWHETSKQLIELYNTI